MSVSSTATYPVVTKRRTVIVEYTDASGQQWEKAKKKTEGARQFVCDGSLGWYLPAGSNGAAAQEPVATPQPLPADAAL